MKKLYIISILTFLVTPLLSQEESKLTPLDIPDQVIYGRSENYASGGVKSDPNKPEILSKALLDSLNDIEKKISPLLPLDPLPSALVIEEKKRRFIKGSFGNYITPEIEGGYSFDINSLKLYSRANVELSDGHMKNAEYSKISLGLMSNYIADSKFWLFGGSNTRSSIDLKNNRYNNYGSSSYTAINNFGLDLRFKTEGKSSGVDFITDFGANLERIDHDTNSAQENGVFASFSTATNNEGIDYLSNFLIDLSNYRGSDISFIGAMGGIVFKEETFDLEVKGGLQTANTSFGKRRFALNLSADYLGYISKLFSYRIGLSSGLEKTKFSDLIKTNPFLSSQTMIDYAHKLVGLDIVLNHHPTDYFGFEFGLNADYTKRNSLPGLSIDTLFLINYVDGFASTLYLESFWEPTSKDRIRANISANYSLIDSNSNQMPYLPHFQSSISYGRKLGEDLMISTDITYIGMRYVDLLNQVQLQPYIDLGLEINYLYDEYLSLFLSAQNLLGADIYVWEQHRQRSLFINLGASIRY